jgi:hypothetical protein
MMGQIESLLEQGIEAARSSETKRARELITRVIELDQHNEKAWLWLSSIVQTPADKEVCLENVLYINPDNTYAAMGLQHLRYRNEPSPPSLLPRLVGDLTAAEREWVAPSGKVSPPPKTRTCPRCQLQNPGWAYLCDRCGTNLRQIDLREVVSEAAKPRGRSTLTLIEAWGGAFVFNGSYAFRPEIELASWGRSMAALAIAVILASAIRIVSAVIVPVLVNEGQYDLRSEFASNALQWGEQTLLLGLALALVWIFATLVTWAGASLLGGKQSLKVHAHLIMVAASAWTLLGAVIAAIIILAPYWIAQVSPLDLPFKQIILVASITISMTGCVWLVQATRVAHDLSPARAILTALFVVALSAITFFGLDMITGGILANSVARPLIVFFLPWLG